MSTLHIGWGLCDRLRLVLVCRGRYGLGGVFLHLILGSSLGGVGPVRGLRGGGRRGLVWVTYLPYLVGQEHHELALADASSAKPVSSVSLV